MIEEIKQYLPIIAIIISFTAVMVSIYNSTISKRSLKIAKKQFQNKLAQFNFYLIDSYSITTENERILLFHVTVTNKSETKNTFSATLNIEYVTENQIVIKMKLPHDPSDIEKVPNKNFTFFPKDLFVSDKESISKWLLFSYRKDLTKGRRIENYILSFKDVNENEQNVSSTIIKELI
ncbi:hypothetical protein AB9T89_18405 [Flavobacterium oncorhynchi]|uniref:hypothetical protein n=1 Tax=Flavobacterium oncorhynchi TaxID=728056 RepID=UPI00351A161C